MANLGQMRPELLLENGIKGTFTFQAADGIRKNGPLLSVAEINQRGHPAWFDGEKSYILPSSATEISALRRLVAQVKSKVPLHMKNGVFKLRAWQDPDAGFTGPGSKK